MSQTIDAPRTARERARVEITAEILDTARRHLAQEGAAALSLRGVARDVGMVSSAVYRYVPNRDALLTMLIIDAYNSLGAAAEKAEATQPRTDYLGRFLAICHAVRGWALAHPHEYALLYGTPVPGYAAPQDTIAPASRVSVVLVGILIDLSAAGVAPAPQPVDATITTSIAPLREFAGAMVSDDLVLRGLAAWSGLFGTITFEIFGQYHNVIAPGARARRTFFDHQMRRVAGSLGLAGEGRSH